MKKNTENKKHSIDFILILLMFLGFLSILGQLITLTVCKENYYGTIIGLSIVTFSEMFLIIYKVIRIRNLNRSRKLI